MIEITAAVEHNLLNALLFRTLRNQLSDFLRACDIAARNRSVLLIARSGRDRGSGTVVDNLSVDMRQAAEHREPGTCGRTLHTLPNSAVNAKSNFVFGIP